MLDLFKLIQPGWVLSDFTMTLGAPGLSDPAVVHEDEPNLKVCKHLKITHISQPLLV